MKFYYAESEKEKELSARVAKLEGIIKKLEERVSHAAWREDNHRMSQWESRLRDGLW